MFAVAEIADLKAANQMLHSIIDSQQQRKPLTDEQINRMFCETWRVAVPDVDAVAFARAIEGAHGITGEPT